MSAAVLTNLESTAGRVELGWVGSCLIMYDEGEG